MRISFGYGGIVTNINEFYDKQFKKDFPNVIINEKVCKIGHRYTNITKEELEELVLKYELEYFSLPIIEEYAELMKNLVLSGDTLYIITGRTSVYVNGIHRQSIPYIKRQLKDAGVTARVCLTNAKDKVLYSIDSVIHMEDRVRRLNLISKYKDNKTILVAKKYPYNLAAIERLGLLNYTNVNELFSIINNVKEGVNNEGSV